jgi:hypothetical protein
MLDLRQTWHIGNAVSPGARGHLGPAVASVAGSLTEQLL